ncbi:hypothetical protein ACLOJK_034272, partial [Asimina triloba]
VFLGGTMATVLAIGFVPGGGFALGDHNSFDLAIPHQFIHVPAFMAPWTYYYVDYSTTAITLATEENWPMLAATTAAA